MRKRADSLPSIGYTTVSVDNITKGKIKTMAGDTPICDFVREMVDDYAEKKQIPMSTGTPGITDVQMLKTMINPINYVKLAVMLAFVGAGITQGFIGIGQDKKTITKKQIEDTAETLSKILDDIPDQGELDISELIAAIEPA